MQKTSQTHTQLRYYKIPIIYYQILTTNKHNDQRQINQRQIDQHNDKIK